MRGLLGAVLIAAGRGSEISVSPRLCPVLWLEELPGAVRGSLAWVGPALHQGGVLSRHPPLSHHLCWVQGSTQATDEADILLSAGRMPSAHTTAEKIDHRSFTGEPRLLSRYWLLSLAFSFLRYFKSLPFSLYSPRCLLKV